GGSVGPRIGRVSRLVAGGMTRCKKTQRRCQKPHVNQREVQPSGRAARERFRADANSCRGLGTPGLLPTLRDRAVRNSESDPGVMPRRTYLMIAKVKSRGAH